MENYTTTTRVFEIMKDLKLEDLLLASDNEVEFINTYFPPKCNGKVGVLIKVESGLLVSFGGGIELLEDMPELSFPSVDSFMIALGSTTQSELRENSKKNSII